MGELTTLSTRLSPHAMQSPQALAAHAHPTYITGSRIVTVIVARLFAMLLKNRDGGLTSARRGA